MTHLDLFLPFPILPGRSVLFHILFIDMILRHCLQGFHIFLMSVFRSMIHYPFLIHLFYTNLQIDHDTGFIFSLVRDIEIEFDSKLLGQILRCSIFENSYSILLNLMMKDIFEQIILPGTPHCPPFKNINL